MPSATRQRRLGWLVLAAATAAFATFYSALPGPAKLLAALAGLALLAFLTADGTPRFFGPVFAYDMLRIGRRRLNFVLRTLYAVLLGLTVAWVYYFEAEVHSANSGGTLSLNQQSRIGEIFFTVFVVVQFCGILLITPGYTAGAISEEKERKTLEFLLATDLRDREIVFGKFLSRVAYLMLYVLAGLPILGFIQFFGGIDPETLYMAYGVTLVSIVSAAAVSILASTVTRRARDAVAVAYLVIVAYLLLSVGLLSLGGLFKNEPPLHILGYRVSFMDVATEVCDGNIACCVQLYTLSLGGMGAGISVPDIFKRYMLFHAGVVVLCVGYSIWKLRAVALAQLFGRVPGSGAKGKARKRRPVGNRPMVWKELFVERARPSTLGRTVAVLLLIASFLPPFFWLTTMDSHDGDFSAYMNGYARVAGAVVCSLMFLAIAVRGAVSIRGEKDRQTFDDLLTTDLTSREIVLGKWIGCVLGLRRGWYWIGAIWLLGVVTAGVHPLAVPALLVAVLVYASGFAWIGIACSLHCASSLKAIMWSIVLSLFCGGGYFIVFGCCCFWPLAMSSAGGGDGLKEVVKVLVGLCPPFAMGYLPFGEVVSAGAAGNRDEWDSLAGYIAVGVALWVCFALVLAEHCLRRFDEIAHRRSYSPETPVAAELKPSASP